MVAFAGVIVMAVMVLLLTVTGAVAVTLLLFDFAVMVVVPRATPVTRPVALTVATLGEDESQVTCEVTLLFVLLPSVAVAVNCWVPLGTIKALVGDKEIETIASAAGKNPPQLLRTIAAKSPAPTLPNQVSHCTLSNLNILPSTLRLTSANRFRTRPVSGKSILTVFNILPHSERCIGRATGTVG